MALLRHHGWKVRELCGTVNFPNLGFPDPSSVGLDEAVAGTY